MCKPTIVHSAGLDDDNVRTHRSLGPHGRAADSAEFAKGLVDALYFISRGLTRHNFECGLGYDPICAERRSSALLAVVAVA